MEYQVMRIFGCYKNIVIILDEILLEECLKFTFMYKKLF